MFALFLVAAAVAAAAATTFAYTVFPCPGGLPTPNSVFITGCDASPCNVFRGDTNTYGIDFSPTASSGAMTLSVFLTALGEERQVQQSNACNTISPSCLVAAGQPVTHIATMSVGGEYHGGVTSTLRVLMTNDENVVNACCLINLIIH